MKKALIILVAITMFLTCVFFTAPKSGFTQVFVNGDIFKTPKTSIDFFAGYTGGYSVGSIDWAIGNGSPFGIRTNDMVFSTCEGFYIDPNDWKERMRITKNGDIGIGTASPAGKLEVADPGNDLSVGILTNTAFPLRVSRNGTAGVLLTDVYAAGDEKNFFMGYTRDVAPNPASLYFAAIDDTLTVSTPLMSLTRAGNVGIGTMNPEAKLHVNGYTRLGPTWFEDNIHGGSNNRLNLISTLPDQDNASYISFTIGDGSQQIETMRIDENSNVGIGTTNPETKLDVEGTVQAHAFETGDIVFRKDGEKLWRMFEDEKGLYLESLKTGEISRIFMEKDLSVLTENIEKLSRMTETQQRKIEALEALLIDGQ